MSGAIDSSLRGRRFAAAAVAAGALAMAGLVGTGGAAQADVVASMSGTLLDSTGSPAANAQVSILTLDQNYADSTTTDDTGHWEVYNLTAGQYDVEFDYDGASSWAYSKASSDLADPITVTDGATTTVDDKTLPIPPATTVGGLITDAKTKAPLKGICVSYAPPSDPGDGRGGGGCTKANGKYTLTVDEPGHWVAVAEDAKGKYVAKVTKPFDIAAGQQLTKNFALSLGGGVSGKVVDRKTGKPLAGICLNANLGHKGGYIVGQAETCSGKTGKWSVRGLPAGKGVTVQLGGDKTHVALWATNAVSQKTAKLFTPKAGKFAAAGTVKLHHGAVLTGKITTKSGKPVVGAWVELGTASSRCGAPCSQWNAKTSKTGTYKITNIDPQHSIVAASAFEQHLATAFSGGTSNPDVAKKLTFKFDGKGKFNAVMLPQAKLQVTVTGVPGTAPTLLDAFSVGGIGIGSSPDLSTPNGTATLGDLPGGKVKLELTYGDNTDQTIWYDNTTTLKKAKTIKLTSGKTTKITFAVS